MEKPTAASARSPLRSIGQEIDQVRTRFAESGAVGVLVIDAMSLEEIERSYGVGAHRQVTGRIAAGAREALSEHLGPGDLVVLGDLGRDEVVVLLFRERRNERFYRAEASRTSPGSGLGLAIVKKLVEEHVGSIRAANRSDGGAMISIRLPINESARGLMIARAPGRADRRREQA